MRIRSIRPEFWTSEDVAAMSWPTRLVFIGLWSYVDDNGVGRDNERLIAADLFPLDEDPHGALTEVAGALKHLEKGGQITRYVVDGKPYLHVTKWSRHQRINRPSESRYPLPTCENAEPHDTLSEHSVSPPALSTVGEVEKGRRGEGKKPSSATADGPTFDDFWTLYPLKKGKAAAQRKWATLTRTTPASAILEGLRFQLPTLAQRDPQFIPHPTTWLNQGRWADEVEAPRREKGWWE